MQRPFDLPWPLLPALDQRVLCRRRRPPSRMNITSPLQTEGLVEGQVKRRINYKFAAINRISNYFVLSCFHIELFFFFFFVSGQLAESFYCSASQLVFQGYITL